MKQKILIVSEYFYPEEFKINDVAIAWQKKGYQVDVLTQIPTYPSGKVADGYSNKWWMKESYQGITIYRVRAVQGYRESLFKKLLKYFVFAFYGSIAAMSIGKKYNYIFGYQVGPLTAMLPAVLINKIFKTPFTIWVQDIWPDSVYAYGFKKTWLLNYALNAFVRFVYRHCTTIAISGPGFMKKIEPYLDQMDKKIEFLPNWADDFTWTDELFEFSKDEKIHFTFAGNIGKMQNLENILHAFGQIQKSLIDKAQLNIIGDGSNLSTLKNIVKSKNYKNIVFWGKQPRSEMAKFYNSSDILILSLIDEPIFDITIPGKLATYIEAKKPIFGIIKGDTAEIIKSYDLGITCHPAQINAITNGFEEFILLPKTNYTQYTQQSDVLMNSLFNKQETIQKLENLLLQAVS